MSRSPSASGRPPDDLVGAAARNNAEWCDIVCRLHGLEGTYRDGAWTVPRRSPPGYPDAVTLDPGAKIDAVLAAIDTSGGCSLKDSFACLDLAAPGFHVLFEARWMARSSAVGLLDPPPGMRWEPVRDPSALREWERAWSRDEIPAGLFRPALLEDGAVAVIAGSRDGEIVAGAILNRSATVAGVTNVFSVEGDLDTAWRGCTIALATYAGDLRLVGYARGDDLEAARRCGFAPLGPLRVWVKGELADPLGP